MQLPFQLTEKSFRRYENHIAKSVINWPKTTSFNPAPLSPNTYAARLRDALKSLEMYNWETNIDRSKLSQIRKELSVQIDKHGNIVIAPKGGDLKEVGSSNNEVQTTKAKTIFNITQSELQACVCLLHSGRIDPVKVTGATIDSVMDACYGKDVEWIEEPDGIVLL